MLDADGYLRITDRKKDLIVLSGGENVSPAKIEGMLMAEPEIAQAVVAGDGRAGLTALVVPGRWLRRRGGGAGGEPHQPPVVGDRTNSQARHSDPAFTVDNGLLTPTQKICRMLVIRANAQTLATLHG